ncbi:MAG: matrixin family metalloprotease [Deltaproteobacteria bacterium]|nr:matrixin family metalloprotease [Deltaproteobacteria bacterium]
MKRGLLAVWVCLQPTLAVAATDNSALECGSTTATYFPRGDHWPGVPPVDTNPVIYSQQQDGAPGIGNYESFNAVQAAFATWTNVQCSGQFANVYIVDGIEGQIPDYPTRDRGDVWVCPDGTDCSSANCDVDTCGLTAVENIVYFVISGWDAIADAGTVALTTNLYIPDTGYIVTADMEFNAVNYQWRANGSGCPSGQSTCFDVETVALHEAGHFLGFNHVMCTDAVMFPQGSGTVVNHALTTHEITAICTIYPPRPTGFTGSRYTGEQCTQTSECPASHVCIKIYGSAADDPWGWCAKTCATTSNCDTGFICVQQDGGTQKFCRPGPNDTGGAVGADPGTGSSLDLCQKCTAGSQCASGVCINSGGTTDGICTQTCVGGTLPDSTTEGSGCPAGLTCVGTDQGWSVCWPDDPVACAAQYSRAKLNDSCYYEGDPSSNADDWFKSCGPELVCFVFKERCGGREGACVTYCNATDKPCPTESGLTCCYGVDVNGGCLGPSADRVHGGCFDLRRPGESCVTAEQSICGDGSGCFNFGDLSTSKCYHMCQAGDSACNTDVETCVTWSDDCQNQFPLCCDTEDYEANGNTTCKPTDLIQYYDVGVACTESAECDSGLCQTYDNAKACSRSCNAVTGGGCPGNIDVNADGLNDGGFRCLLIANEGRCWPIDGPVAPPANTAIDDGGGCCNATRLRPGDVLLAALLWLPMAVARWRRRR